MPREGDVVGGCVGLFGVRCRVVLFVVALVCAWLFGGVGAAFGAASAGERGDGVGGGGERVLRIPMTTSGPRTLDPVSGSSTYDNRAVVQVYETLLGYSYFKRPLELEPLLLSEMPEELDGGMRYRFRLREDVYFQDDPCFPEGKGRRMTVDDVFYSWKRLADPAYRLQNWSRVAGMIVGFDAFKEAQVEAVAGGLEFDYGAAVEGLVKLDDFTFEVLLPEVDRQFLWKLATFQMAVVPREAVEFYGRRFESRMVGTGPFRFVRWVPGSVIEFERNPTYREAFYPMPEDPADIERGFGVDAGKQLPLADRMEFHFFVEMQPMWLEFRAGGLDFVTVPESGFAEAFNPRTKRLRREWRQRGIDYQPVPLADFIYRGFNMRDPVVGGYAPERVALRRAIAMCMDLDEINESRYNGIPVIYDGFIPPGVPGHLPAGSLQPPHRGPDFDEARRLLAKAGYTVVNGRVVDLPPIDFFTSRGADTEQLFEMYNRNLTRVGIQMNPRYVDFAKLTEELDNARAPMFGLAWGMAYPDAEYNLLLFYGPNAAPRPNKFNFENAEYDALYHRIKVMEPGSERDAVYLRMQEIVNEYCVFIGSQARVRQYLAHPWLRNFKATETFFNYKKYLDIDPELVPRGR